MTKPCAFINQDLVSHSIGSYTQALRMLDDTYYSSITKRLEKVGINVDKTEVKEKIELVIKLHDIGKAGEYYQEQFDENCNPIRDNVSFIYHEIGSALFFYHNFKDKIGKLLTLAVLNHLNAMRTIKDLSPTSFPKGYKIEMAKLQKYGKVLLDSLDYSSYSVKDYTLQDYNQMMNELLRERGPYLKLYTLFLAPIIVGDSLDSQYARNSSNKRRFIQLLEVELSENTYI